MTPEESRELWNILNNQRSNCLRELENTENLMSLIEKRCNFPRTPKIMFPMG